VVQSAASTTGQQILVVNASNDGELDTAFTVLTQQHVDALLVMADPFLNSRPDKIVALAARYALPAMYPWREFPKAEGLMSYGTELAAHGARLAFMAEKFSREPSPPTFPFNSR
jgi:putative ABC transport system substrate-binding protein